MVQNMKLTFSTYQDNGKLAVLLVTTHNDSYDVVTVNPDSPLQSDRLAFVDENNLPGIGQWLRDNGLAHPLGYSQRSGFCTYPLYSFIFLPGYELHRQNSHQLAGGQPA